MAAERNPAFDVYCTNLVFALRLSHLMQESHQRLHQFQAQAAERALAANGKMAEAVGGARDWSSLATLSSSLIRQQSELATAFWQDLFAVASNNRLTLLNGMREAAEDLQTKHADAFQGSAAALPQRNVFEDMLKPFEPFANAMATYNKPAHTPSTSTAKRNASHA